MDRIKHAGVCALIAILAVMCSRASARASWSDYRDKPDQWYRSEEGIRIADNILSWQSAQGSWPKNVDTMSRAFSGDPDSLDGTFDNGATVGELRFLARAFRATGDRRYEQAFLKGLDHILEAQYPTGGWPQSYPPGRGYPRHITFNDGTMTRLMDFLREVETATDYEFVDPARREAARTAVRQGVGCILKCQVVVDGKRTAWCAQHDEIDYSPRPGRTYELVSLSGAESADILRFLMSLDDPSPEVAEAITAGVAWFESAKLTGIRQTRVDGDKVIVEDADARPLWARFYEIGTNRPIFCGRDGVQKYSLAEIEAERRNGYAWYGDWGRPVASEYAKWQKKWPAPADTKEDTAADLKVIQLTCEYARDPLGVDVSNPRLSWKLESDVRGRRQNAYRILACSSAECLAAGEGDLWDSGKVTSDETAHIAYRGRKLVSSERVFWKVRVWDEQGSASTWSGPASWTMGLLDQGDWRAHWIGSATDSQSLFLRRDVTVKAALRRAVVHVCGLGHYEMSINGAKVSEDLLAPGWSKYDRTCLYDTYDVTSLLREGDNAIGLVLGNGMYNVRGGRYIKFKGSFGPLKAICHVRLEYADGTTEIICTDRQWRTHPGPITFSCVYGGEDHDARLEPRDWDRPGFDDSGWPVAQEVDGPGGTLKGLSCAASPIRAFDVLEPVSVRTLRLGVTVYDLGQNASIMPRLKVAGPAGSVVRITPAELLNDDGSVDRGSCGGGQAYWQYTLAGAGAETWFPKFFYHGSRYLQVECLPAERRDERPAIESLEGVVVHSSAPPVGEFACSNELFNRIHTLIRWAQRSNMVSVMTDCPHREKLGWLEQYHLNGPSLRYEFDLMRLFAKGMNDMADSQLDSGLVPDIAPEYVVFDGGFRDSPEWGSACVLVPWQQYQWTGDTELLRRYYDNMTRYVAYLGSKAKNHIVSHGLGDWYDIGPNPPGYAQLTPIPLTATAFYFCDAWILSETATLLGKTEDAERYRELAAEIRRAFNASFFDEAAGRYATGSQCANAIALVMGLVEPEHRQSVLDAIVADVRQRGNAITAGDVGYRYLLCALAAGGRSDVIFDLNNQSDKPGYGYQLKMGATSLTEAWDARRSSSHNHFMLGQIMEWFYHDLAGIASDPAGPGFRKIIIRPQPVGDVTWAKASYDSLHGKISVQWDRTDGRFTLKAAVPANTTATVFVPVGSGMTVTEGGRPAESSPGVTFLRREGGRAVYAVPSGRYEFHSRL